MLGYSARRLILMIPTLLGILLINFAIIQFVPGGPVEQTLAQIRGDQTDALAWINRGSGGSQSQAGQTTEQSGRALYRGAEGLDPAVVEEIKRAYGFDKPWYQRLGSMLSDFLQFKLGESLFQNRSVLDMLIEKLPVSISLGLWTTLLAYLISIPLGIRKAVNDGSRFDIFTSFLIVIGNAIPSFLFAVLLIVLFSKGSVFFPYFPYKGIVSDNWADLEFWAKITDYIWHITLPVIAMTIGGFASLTLLTKNSFIDQIRLQYVQTARAKGLSESQVLWGHVFRNAMLVVISGFPGAFVAIFFTGSLLIEVTFSIEGLGLLAYEAAITRDYPVIMGFLYFSSILGLLMRLITDLSYMLIDPRIDFGARKV